jgi:hypothetical protein
VLEALAKGYAEARLTKEARSALGCFKLQQSRADP